MNDTKVDTQVPQLTRLNHTIKCTVDDILWQALQTYSRTRCMCMADVCRLALFALVSRVDLYRATLDEIFQQNDE